MQYCFCLRAERFNRPAINVNFHIFPSSFVLLNTGPFLFPLQSTCYQCELQYLAIFICLLECWCYSISSFKLPTINLNFNILPSSLLFLNADPILWFFESTCSQFELQYLAMFICLHQCLSYSIWSF